MEIAKEAWVTLQKLYKGDERIKRMKLQILRGEFKSLHINDSESISYYFDQVQTIVNHMRVNGEKLDDQQIVNYVLLKCKIQLCCCSNWRKKWYFHSHNWRVDEFTVFT